MGKVRNHMCDTGCQNNERFVLIQCFNDVTAIVYVSENHIIKTLDPFMPLITLAFDINHMEFYFVHTELGLKNTRGTAIILLEGLIEKVTSSSILKSSYLWMFQICLLIWASFFLSATLFLEVNALNSSSDFFLRSGKLESFKGKKL